MNKEIPVIGFVAFSGTGKTTLLRKLLAIFTGRKIRVGVIKHAHHNFDIDHPGKDSYELRKAGARQMLVCSDKRWALMTENEQQQDRPLAFYLDNLNLDELDMVFVEGFKNDPVPKIEVHRCSMKNELLSLQDKNIIAVATDTPASITTGLPVLDLNDPEQITDFIIDRFLN